MVRSEERVVRWIKDKLDFDEVKRREGEYRSETKNDGDYGLYGKRIG